MYALSTDICGAASPPRTHSFWPACLATRACGTAAHVCVRRLPHARTGTTARRSSSDASPPLRGHGAVREAPSDAHAGAFAASNTSSGRGGGAPALRHTLLPPHSPRAPLAPRFYRTSREVSFHPCYPRASKAWCAVTLLPGMRLRALHPPPSSALLPSALRPSRARCPLSNSRSSRTRDDLIRARAPSLTPPGSRSSHTRDALAPPPATTQSALAPPRPLADMHPARAFPIRATTKTESTLALRTPDAPSLYLRTMRLALSCTRARSPPRTHFALYAAHCAPMRDDDIRARAKTSMRLRRMSCPLPGSRFSRGRTDHHGIQPAPRMPRRPHHICCAVTLAPYRVSRIAPRAPAAKMAVYSEWGPTTLQCLRFSRARDGRIHACPRLRYIRQPHSARRQRHTLTVHRGWVLGGEETRWNAQGWAVDRSVPCPYAAAFQSRREAVRSPSRGPGTHFGITRGGLCPCAYSYATPGSASGGLFDGDSWRGLFPVRARHHDVPSTRGIRHAPHRHLILRDHLRLGANVHCLCGARSLATPCPSRLLVGCRPCFPSFSLVAMQFLSASAQVWDWAETGCGGALDRSVLPFDMPYLLPQHARHFTSAKRCACKRPPAPAVEIPLSYSHARFAGESAFSARTRTLIVEDVDHRHSSRRVSTNGRRCRFGAEGARGAASAGWWGGCLPCTLPAADRFVCGVAIAVKSALADSVGVALLTMGGRAARS
ncbi:hypothetical protein C8J57DRAFT_1577293 [Mycena rebaudengoi]|nr:hypothetical protein C8J57DRAFT_1577293 [Mycena rebaudengoi]